MFTGADAVVAPTSAVADEIGEVLLHTAVYAGVPAANRALAVAQRVLDELGLDGPAQPSPGPQAEP